MPEVIHFQVLYKYDGAHVHWCTDNESGIENFM
jgi:hypothetical protein